MRLEGWELRLAEEIEAARARPFAYGEHDCLTWAFRVRAALTGKDESVMWAGRYKTALGAARVMKNEGVTLEEIGHKLLGRPLSSVLMAQRGDIVFDLGYGVCIGAMWVHPTENGLKAEPLAAGRVAWRV